MSEHDPKKAAPPQGPVPDPHADKPAPLPDAHSRPAPDADVIRPDQDEELGPAVELFRAAGAEAAAEVLRTDEARAEAVRRGAEPEGVEAAQIFSLLLATFVALVMGIVGIFFMVDYLAYEQLERRAGEASYPARRQIEARDADLLGNYAAGEDGTYRIPIATAMDQVAAAYYRQQQGAVAAPENFNTVVANTSAAYDTGTETAGARPDTTAAGAAAQQTPDQPVQNPPTQQEEG